MAENGLETATLAAGCFWCVEAVFDDLKGVHDVVSGYSGGHKENPTYQEVCSETTGHAEVVQVRFGADAAEAYIQTTIDQPRALFRVPLAGSSVSTWRMPRDGEDGTGIWHKRYYVPGSKMRRRTEGE